MSQATSRTIERLAVIGVIDPDAYGTGGQDTSVVDMQYWRRVRFVVMAGDIVASGTVDFAVKGDTESNGSFATTITGKTITQLTQAGTDSNKQAVVEVTAEEVMAQGLRYLRGTLTLAAAGADAAVLVEGEPAHYTRDVTGHDLTAVDELVG